MPIAFIGLGSNLGDRAALLDRAIRSLRALPHLRMLAVSNIYQSKPIDAPAGSGDYLNAVAQVETTLAPLELLDQLQFIEKQQGRIRHGIANEPRTLDLDLLLYDDLILDHPRLILPHPRLHERAFVLLPWNELASDVQIPGRNKTIQQLLDQLSTAQRAEVVGTTAARTASHDLAGQTILVTGGTRGIGAAICTELAWRGAEILIHGRNAERANGLAEKLKHVTHNNHRVILADVGTLEGNRSLAESVWTITNGQLDGVICNAGADTLTGDAKDWSFAQKLDTLLEVDLKGTMFLARDLGQQMKQRGWGNVVTIGWDQAETGMEGDSGELFAAVKGAIICFTRSLAKSLAPEVRVNCISPGWIRTEWGETASTMWQERVKQETPLQRWGMPEDIASAAAWIVSPGAAFITGQTICVNGGVQ